MSTPVRLTLLSVVGLGLACLLLAVTGAGRTEETASALLHGFVIATCMSLFVGLAILYGHATRCPSCRRWYAKKDHGNELIDSAIYDRDGAVDSSERRPVFKVLTYHHKHHCSYCGHQWVTTFIDRFASTVRRRSSLDPADGPKRPKRHRID